MEEGSQMSPYAAAVKVAQLSSIDLSGHEDSKETNSLSHNLFLEPEDNTTSSTVDPAADNHNPLLPPESDHHYRHIPILSIDATVAIRQLPVQGIAFQLWPAATALVSLLDLHCRRLPALGPLSAAVPALPRRLRVLELGSGTGLVGIAAASILGAAVTVTDVPQALPNLSHNTVANAAAVAQRGGSVRVAALRWGVAEDSEAVGRHFDLVLGSDLVYHDHLYDPLLQTLRFLLLGRGDCETERAVFVMAHLRRWKKESAFFRKARKMFEVERVHMDDPRPGSRVGVVVYTFAGKRQGLKATTKIAVSPELNAGDKDDDESLARIAI